MFAALHHFSVCLCVLPGCLNFVLLLVESWWAHNGLAAVVVHVNCQAGQEGENGCIEHADEDGSCEICHYSDHDDWSVDILNVLLSLLEVSAFLHHVVAGDHVTACDSNLAHEHENFGDHVGE